jgi:hypothetical protein
MRADVAIVDADLRRRNPPLRRCGGPRSDAHAQMPVKQDAIPGMMITVWFGPTGTTSGAPSAFNGSPSCGQTLFWMRDVLSRHPAA